MVPATQTSRIRSVFVINESLGFGLLVARRPNLKTLILVSIFNYYFAVCSGLFIILGIHLESVCDVPF